MTELPLIFTCGDPAGIGPEVVASWLAANPQATPLVVGHPRWLDSLRQQRAGSGWLPVAVAAEEPMPELAQPDLAGARIALAALEMAAELVRAGKGGAVVTGPVSKLWLSRVGYPYPGQTEFFAARWGGEPIMAFGGERMRVVLATWHIPLMEVAQALSEHGLRRAVEAAQRLACAAGVVAPRIAVCGLNPHAGEGGILGGEEREQINVWLDRIRETHPGISSCQPADTLFWRHLQGEFDVVVALYHDQGLAPLKTVEFDSAANLTLGLPFVRTSPDHGTAYALAGKGVASVRSFQQAVLWAERLIKSPPDTIRG